MAKRIYVTNPQISVGADPAQIIFCYAILEWEQGLPAILHPPCNEDTIVFLAFNDNAGTARQKIIDNAIAHFPGITAADVIFIPEIGAAV
jgi:hypothetical protein